MNTANDHKSSFSFVGFAGPYWDRKKERELALPKAQKEGLCQNCGELTSTMEFGLEVYVCSELCAEDLNDSDDPYSFDVT